MAARVVSANDARMFERRDCRHFAFEPLKPSGLRDSRRWKQLDGAASLEPLVLGEADGPHAAVSKVAEDAIRPQVDADSQLRVMLVGQAQSRCHEKAMKCELASDFGVLRIGLSVAEP